MVEPERIIREVLERYPEEVVFAYLFGSSARAPAKHAGDVDIAVYVEHKDRNELCDFRLEIYGALSRALCRNDVDIVILNSAQNLVLLHEILRYGILLVDRNPDLRLNFEQKTLHSAIDFTTHRKALMGV